MSETTLEDVRSALQQMDETLDPGSEDWNEECMTVLGGLGLRVRRNGSYTHICALCKHSSSQHTATEPFDLLAGPYVCPCGCRVRQRGPGFWLSERDFLVWQDAFPLVLRVVRDFFTEAGLP